MACNILTINRAHVNISRVNEIHRQTELSRNVDLGCHAHRTIPSILTNHRHPRTHLNQTPVVLLPASISQPSVIAFVSTLKSPP